MKNIENNEINNLTADEINERDHLFIFNILKTLASADKQSVLIEATEQIFDHFISEKNQALVEAENNARVQEIEGIVSVANHYRPDADTTLFSDNLYRSIMARHQEISLKRQNSNASNIAYINLIKAA